MIQAVRAPGPSARHYRLSEPLIFDFCGRTSFCPIYSTVK